MQVYIIRDFVRNSKEAPNPTKFRIITESGGISPIMELKLAEGRDINGNPYLVYGKHLNEFLYPMKHKDYNLLVFGAVSGCFDQG